MPPSPAAGSARSSSARTTAASPGIPSATSSTTTAFPEPTSGTTAHRIPGSSSASGILNLRSQTPTPSLQALKMPHSSNPQTAETPGSNSPVCARTAPVPVGSPAQAVFACTPFFSIQRIPTVSSSPSQPQGPFAAMTQDNPGSPSTRACGPSTSLIQQPRLATASTTSP
jgi:hypothetical protein